MIGVVGKYVYYEEGDEPSSEDIERSEILEGRMREGFARIRQLTVTRSIIPHNPFGLQLTRESRL